MDGDDRQLLTIPGDGLAMSLRYLTMVRHYVYQYGDTDNYEDGHADDDTSKPMHKGRVPPPSLHEQSSG